MYQVIFDMDGVIIDSERALLECWLDTARGYGLAEEDVRRAYMRCIGCNSNQTKQIYREAFLDALGEDTLWQVWEESFKLNRQRYQDGVLPLKPGVREILDYLKQKGVPVGIASSTDKRTVDQRIAAVGLSEYFIGSIGGDAVKISKPNPEIYLLACATFGFAPETTFAIEDSYNGIRAARAAGMRPIMVPDLVPPDAEMRMRSERICKDLFEVIAYLEQN